MIQGTFGDEDELFFEIELIADNGLELPVDALLDTGFSGWLAINDQDLDGLDWTYVKENLISIFMQEKCVLRVKNLTFLFMWVREYPKF